MNIVLEVANTEQLLLWSKIGSILPGCQGKLIFPSDVHLNMELFDDVTKTVILVNTPINLYFIPLCMQSVEEGLFEQH